MKKRIMAGCFTFAILFSAFWLFGAGRIQSAMADGGSETRVTRILLLGNDRAASLTDAIMLLTIKRTTGEVTLLQIPRDTYAEYTERDYKKLNGAPKALGEREFKEFLSRAIGAPIHYYLAADLDLFRTAVDVVGGVDIDIPADMSYEDPAQGLVIEFQKGPNHLNGEDAEKFVRYRSGYANADLGRLDAQKLFMRALLSKCRTLSPIGICRLLLPVILHTKTDLDPITVISLLPIISSLDTESLPMETLPGEAVQGKSGAWYYVPCREACRELLPSLIGSDPDAFDPEGLFDREDHPDFHRIYTAMHSNRK